MFSLPNFAIKRPVCITVCLMALVIFGARSIFGMPLESAPELSMPTMTIRTTYRGASPEEVDLAVTEKLENALASVKGIQSMSSTSGEGSSSISVEFDYSDDMDARYEDVKAAIERVRLPDGCSDPSIMRVTSSDFNTSIMSLSVITESGKNMVSYLEDMIQPRLEKIEGVAEVSISGGAREYISVELDENRMKQYGLTMQQVSSAIANAEFETTVGSIERGDVNLSLVGSADYETYRHLAQIPISIGRGNVIYLDEIATVSMKEQERTSYNRFNGMDRVNISIAKEQSGNTVSICNQVAAIVEEINAGNYGFTIDINSSNGEEIMDNIKSVVSSLLLGMMISALVLFLFFGEWKASLIVGLSMPISVLTALVAMSYADMSINLMSLGGLVVGIGMMVDNSIVVLESCFRARNGSRSFRESAEEGANLVTGSIIASTATTIVVFLPIGLMKGIAGQLFRDVCFTIAFAMLASLVSALTLVPLLFVKLEPHERIESLCNRALRVVDRGYAKLIGKALNARKTVVAIALICLAAAGYLFSSIRMEMMPSSDEGRVNLTVQTKTGLKLDSVNEIMLQIEEIVRQQPDVDSYRVSASASGGGMRGGSGSSGSVNITLRKDRSMTTDEFVNDLREKTAGIRNCVITTSAQSSMSFGSGRNVQIKLVGENYNDLKIASAQVQAQLADTPGIFSTSSSISSGAPRAKLEIDPILSGAIGMTPYEVLQAASRKLSGITATTFRQGGDSYSVVVEYPTGYETVNDLYGLTIEAAGKQVSITDLGEIVYEEGPTSIQKADGEYVVTVTGTPAAGSDVTSMTTAAVAAAKTLLLPDGVRVEAGSSMRQMNREFKLIYQALLTAIFLVFAVMAIQFESMAFSIVVMISIPFSMTGAFFALAVTGSSISMSSLLGLVMLVGIVVNNAIVLIDYTNILRARGMAVREALMLSCRTRLRPILMSTITTVFGLVPLAVGFGGEVELIQDMAISVIGGLSFSTLLTLIVIPTFYLIFDREDRANRRAARAEKRRQKRAAAQ